MGAAVGEVGLNVGETVGAVGARVVGEEVGEKVVVGDSVLGSGVSNCPEARGSV